MLSKSEIDLLKKLSKNLFKSYTYNEIKLISKKNSNSMIQFFIKKLKEEQIIIEKKFGNLNIYNLNLNNESLFNYLQLSNSLDKSIVKIIEELKFRIEEHTLFYSVILFGSYASKKNSKNSDIDILILVPNNKIISKIEVEVENINRKSLIELDTFIVSKKNFTKMLTNSEENLVKEIVRNSLPIHNSNIYYKILRKEFENGTRVQNIFKEI